MHFKKRRQKSKRSVLARLLGSGLALEKTSSSRTRYLEVETLEDRRLLAGYAFGSLPKITGYVAPGDTSTHRFEILPGDFQMAPNTHRVTLQFFAKPTETSSLQLSAIEVRYLNCSAADILYESLATHTPGASVAVAAFSTGEFEIRLEGLDDTSGDYEPVAALVGDLDGNRVVDQEDAKLLRDSLNSSLGDARYLSGADITMVAASIRFV